MLSMNRKIVYEKFHQLLRLYLRFAGKDVGGKATLTDWILTLFVKAGTYMHS